MEAFFCWGRRDVGSEWTSHLAFKRGSSFPFSPLQTYSHQVRERGIFLHICTWCFHKKVLGSIRKIRPVF